MLHVDHCRKVVKARKNAIAKLMVEVYPITVLVQLVFPDSPDDGKIDYEVSRDDTVGKSNAFYTAQVYLEAYIRAYIILYMLFSP